MRKTRNITKFTVKLTTLRSVQTWLNIKCNQTEMNKKEHKANYMKKRKDVIIVHRYTKNVTIVHHYTKMWRKYVIWQKCSKRTSSHKNAANVDQSHKKCNKRTLLTKKWQSYIISQKCNNRTSSYKEFNTRALPHQKCNRRTLSHKKI